MKILKKTQKTKEQRIKEFGERYEALCNELNCVIKIEPYFFMERDGSYVVKINRYISEKEVKNG